MLWPTGASPLAPPCKNRGLPLARIVVVETCDDSAAALQRYRELHRPLRPLAKTGDYRERRWLGLRETMRLTLHDNLLFISVHVAHDGQTIEVHDVVVDTGPAAAA